MFLKSSAFNLLILPFLVSIVSVLLIDIYDFNIINIQGFSAILAGFIGYMIYCTYNFFRNKTKLIINRQFFWLLFFINIVVYLITISNLLAIPIMLILLMMLYIERTNLLGIKNIIKEEGIKLAETGHFEKSYKIFLSMFVVFFLFSSFIGLLTLENTGTTTTNILGHYIGYMLGLFAPLALEKI
jgi:hypothetical protein